MTQDRVPEPLLQFYRYHHACTRAKIAAWHLRDDEVQDRQKWLSKARHYLYLAAAPEPDRHTG